MNSSLLWAMAIVGTLTGALQVKEFIAPWYVMGRAAITSGFEIIDLNLDRQTPPMEGLNQDE